MTTRLTLSLLLLLLLVLLLPRIGAAEEICPGRFADAQADSLVCRCEAGAFQRTVYGDLTYTDDSDLCTAAIHAGAISAVAGGLVEARAAPGCAEYPAVTRNGVASWRWGTWQRSLYFPAVSTGGCGEERGQVSSELADCPARFRDAGEDRVSCHCPDDRSAGQVYGTLIYTDDSDLCGAARHAGVLSGTGYVEALAAPGCGAYQGSTRNGVTSANWGAWQRSFLFQVLGPLACQR